MRNLMIFLFLLISCHCYAQNISAVTDDGKKVILNSDGTWRYLNSDQSDADTVSKNLINYNKSAASTGIMNLKGDKISVYYNPALWQQKPSNDPTKTILVHKDGEVYGMIIYERVSLDPNVLKNVAINNAKVAAPDTRVISQEYRIVNGVKIFCMKMEGTIQDIKFAYYGYYYAGKAGTLQLLTYTYANLLPDYEKVMTDFLNGLVIKE